MSGLGNKAWSRANVTINQRWRRIHRGKRQGTYLVIQCHHVDALIEMVAEEDMEGTHAFCVSTTDLRNTRKWERVS